MSILTDINRRFTVSRPPILIFIIVVIVGQLLGARYRSFSIPVTIGLIVFAIILEGYSLVEETRSHFNRALFAAAFFVVFVTVIELIGLGHLLVLLFSGGQEIHGGQLLISGLYFWSCNILTFGLWFWLIDEGGPYARARGEPGRPDFFFPEMAAGELKDPAWMPGLFEYMYLAFTNATAFSPTDTLPLSTRARALMTVESALSLITLALVTARAVNILS